MSRFLFLCSIVLISFVSTNAQDHQTLFPAPSNINYQQGTLPVNNISVTIPVSASPDVKFALTELKDFFNNELKKSPKSSPAGSVAIHYTIKNKGFELPAVNEKSGTDSREFYRLKITASSVDINANTSTGLYYAVQTIRQLIEISGNRMVLPAVTIEDKPALPLRGVMMDFAHGPLLRVDEIKRQIDFLARWKTNQYYFYNEVSIELKGYPTINYGANYTQKEIKEIIDYGSQRHMDVIPFVAFYGHLHEFVRNEKYSSLAIGKYGQELDPRKPGVQDLLKNWIKQYVQLFHSPFIHVGFDETWETNRISKDVDSSIHSEDLWLQHLGFVQSELKKYGKTVLAWTDMNNYYPDVMSRFPKEAIPVIWEYTPDTVAIYHYLNPVLKEKRSFFIQPAVSGWGHIYPASTYTYDNIDFCLKAGMRNNTLGFITSVWTDAVESFTRPSWMFMAYGCIDAWQGIPPDRSSFIKTYSKLTFPAVATEMEQAFESFDKANEYLAKCLGKNTGNMPGGTITESWLNPFSSYYLANTKEHIEDFKKARELSQQTESFLIGALDHCDKKDTAFINSLLVSAQLINYSATRFIWAKTICDRWNESMLTHNKNDFVYYDIAYPCHGLIVDMMDQAGMLQDAYAASWMTENKSYRLNTMLERFTVELGLWQKLELKVQEYRIQHARNYVATQSFEETFKPEF